MRDIATFLKNADEQDLHLLRAALDQRMAQFAPPPGMRALSQNFRVPAETKYLDASQLDRITEVFSDWFNDAASPAYKRSRGRLWLVFLVIRFGALRLGEALALDDTRDFDRKNGTITVRGTAGRTVQLSPAVMHEVMKVLEAPMFYAIRGTVLQLDQGYLRRKFYERAKECGIPGTLLNPRVLRHSRGIELLRGGVPMPVVQAFMGQASLNLTADFLEFADDTAERIVHQFITREVQMKTSARNAFTGKVTRIVQDGLLVEVELKTISGLCIVSVITQESFKNLGLVEGSVAIATVKAPWVILTAQEHAVKTSARNSFPGTIVSVKTSEIAAEAVVELADGTKVCALVTNESVKKLDLREGHDIMVMFKAFSVILNAD